MLPLNPARISQQFQQARALQQTGRLEEARTIFTSLLAAAPDIAEAHFHLARIYRRQGMVEKAIEHMERAREIKPEEQAILTALADYYAAAGRFEEATAIYGPLIAAQPNNPAHRIDKAYMLRFEFA